MTTKRSQGLRDDDGEDPMAEDNKKTKREGEEEEEGSGLVKLDEDLLFEVLKHVDARSLAAAACVSKLWHRTAQDERLWEMVCTRHWANIGCGNQQLRFVVLALGGFRRLHSLCLWPLLKPSPLLSSSSSSSSSSSFVVSSDGPTRWGKDEMNLSLSLLSIRYYEKMNPSKRDR